MKNTMFGPMPGPGTRYYSLGAVMTQASGQGKYRYTAAVDPENRIGKATLVGDVFGDGRLRLTGQIEKRALDAAAGTEWGLTAAYVTEEWVGVARAKNGSEVGGSYCRRLGPSSPLQIGGEAFFNVPGMAALASKAWSGRASSSTVIVAGVVPSRSAAPASAPSARPYDVAFGGAYDTGLSKTAVHLSSTSAFPAVLSVHHLARVTDRTTLAGKYMYNMSTGGTMAAAGYKLRLRNTGSTVAGMIDTYGTVRVMVEREPLKDVRVGLSLEGRLSPAALAAPGPEGPVTLGFQVSAGTASRIPVQQSPCTMARTIFGAT
jgi:hypothetical protein